MNTYFNGIKLKVIIRVAVVLLAIPGHAAEQNALVAPLRAAIEDLAATHGAKYPGSREFLERLAKIEQDLREGQGGAKEKAAEEFALLKKEALLANPSVSGQPLLYVLRPQYASGYHAVDTLFHTSEANTARFKGGGALKIIDFGKGGATRTLLDCPEGLIRDPNIYFDGSKVVFAMRRNIKEDYHIWEIKLDGSGLRQLTCAEGVSDYNPIYLPDDSIVFSSTREPKYNQCSQDIAVNLYRMEADGANIRQISRNNLIDDQVSLMADGRILYSRWEYVDRNFGDAHGLWTTNPDGTSHLLYWKNNTTVPAAAYMARQLPGSDLVICILGPHHGYLNGALALVDRRLGIEGRPGIVRTWPSSAVNWTRIGGNFDCNSAMGVRLKYAMPHPLDEKHFLCSRMTGVEGKKEEMGLFLVDVFGNELALHSESPGCFDLMPVMGRKRPPIIPDRVDYSKTEGYLFVRDVYEGTHMAGVKRGSVKTLRVVEVPEKRSWSNGRWFGHGYTAPGMNWHSLEAKRILGTVPVEADGSAYFALPAEKFVYFQLLDEEGMMIQSMRSGTIVQPGEKQSCIGCHDNRLAMPMRPVNGLALALRKPPHELKNPSGEPQNFSYVAEVQPIFNKSCLGCHDFGKEGAEKLILAPDRDLTFNISYTELWTKKYVTCVGAGPADIQQAYSWGSHPSRLIQVLRGGHHDVKLSQREMETLVTWLDLNGVYYPSYQCAYPNSHSGRCPLTRSQLKRLCALLGPPYEYKDEFSAFNSYSGGRVMVSFDRPELSPCLEKFTDRNSPEYKEALELIRAGGAQLAKQPEADRPGFVPCEKDLQREQKYERLRQRELAFRKAIMDGKKLYDGQMQDVGRCDVGVK